MNCFLQGLLLLINVFTLNIAYASPLESKLNNQYENACQFQSNISSLVQLCAAEQKKTSAIEQQFTQHKTSPLLLNGDIYFLQIENYSNIQSIAYILQKYRELEINTPIHKINLYRYRLLSIEPSHFK